MSCKLDSVLGNETVEYPPPPSSRSNRLVRLEAGCLDGLVALEELVLTRNRLSSLTKGLFRDLKGLTTLELNRNRFVEIQVREIILVKKSGKLYWA